MNQTVDFGLLQSYHRFTRNKFSEKFAIRLISKWIIFPHSKNAPAYYNTAGAVAVNSEVVGFGPEGRSKKALLARSVVCKSTTGLQFRGIVSKSSQATLSTQVLG
jgi:hypothetical protein